jgi:hypothetical protein
MALEKVVDFQPSAPPDTPSLGRASEDPVKRLFYLLEEEQEHIHLAKKAQLEQLQLIHEQRGNPQLEAALHLLCQSHPQERRIVRDTLSIDQFLGVSEVIHQPPVSVEVSPGQYHPSSQRIVGWKPEDLADRSKWSPKLRALIDRLFPEEGKEERIRRATQITRSFKLGEGLTLEEVKYYAEDVEIEYDV